jgi:hypothetical protein
LEKKIMNKRTSIAGAVAILAIAGSTQADVVLEIDLTVTDQITITATDAASLSTVSGSDTTGFYLEDIFAGGPGGISDTLISGDLTSFLNTSDSSPLLFSTDSGLNVFSYTDDPTSDFVAGTQAFSGSATWAISSADYAALLAGNTSGNVWAIADTFDDIVPGGGDAQIIGEYFVIPAPGVMALLGVAGLASTRRRRG